MPGRKGKRRRVDRGIFEDLRGFEVRAYAHGQEQWKRYPKKTALRKMRTWRDETETDFRSSSAPTKDPSTLAGAIDKYLKKTQNQNDADLAALNAWAALYGSVHRDKLTAAMCVQAFERWTHAGYSKQSLYYRRLVILKVWRALDGPKTKTPVDDITISRPKAGRPVWVDDGAILAVLQRLKMQEMAGRLRSAKTRARFLVLVTTGKRPAQLKITERGDVMIYRRPVEGIYGVWGVRKVKGGEGTPVYLNREQCAAWIAFIVAEAWGEYDTRSFARTLRYAGWPRGVRPYNVRHAVGLTLSEKGIDTRDISSHMDHTSISTTTTFYVPQLHSRLKDGSRALEGRFSGERTPSESRSVVPVVVPLASSKKRA